MRFIHIKCRETDDNETYLYQVKREIERQRVLHILGEERRILGQISVLYTVTSQVLRR
jgi:hypothetical protein